MSESRCYMNKYSLVNIFTRFKVKISITLILVILELVASILYPLFIGFAINDLIKSNYNGLMMLVVLTVVSIIVGAARRFYDSRVYSKVFCKVADELTEDERQKGSTSSKISARVYLLTELVEFFENSFPEIVGSFIGVIGILIILFGINMKIFFMCIGIILVIFIVYGVTTNLNWSLNKEYNDESEHMVAIIDSKDDKELSNYFKRIMRLNIKLSDLEMGNYSVISVFSMAAFLASMMIVISEGNVQYGTVMAILMYVYDFVGRVSVLPLYYQNYIRLQEITTRLAE